MELGLFNLCLEQMVLPAGLQGLNVNLEEVVLPTGLQNPGVGFFNLGLEKARWPAGSPAPSVGFYQSLELMVSTCLALLRPQRPRRLLLPLTRTLRPWRPIALRKLSWQSLTVLSRETTVMAATSLKESGAFKANVLTCEPSGQPTAMRSSAASRTPSGIQRRR